MLGVIRGEAPALACPQLQRLAESPSVGGGDLSSFSCVSCLAWFSTPVVPNELRSFLYEIRSPACSIFSFNLFFLIVSICNASFNRSKRFSQSKACNRKTMLLVVDVACRSMAEDSRRNVSSSSVQNAAQEIAVSSRAVRVFTALIIGFLLLVLNITVAPLGAIVAFNMVSVTGVDAGNVAGTEYPCISVARATSYAFRNRWRRSSLSPSSSLSSSSSEISPTVAASPS
jgi:hypothetical protein